MSRVWVGIRGRISIISSNHQTGWVKKFTCIVCRFCWSGWHRNAWESFWSLVFINLKWSTVCCCCSGILRLVWSKIAIVIISKASILAWISDLVNSIPTNVIGVIKILNWYLKYSRILLKSFLMLELLLIRKDIFILQIFLMKKVFRYCVSFSV